MFTCRGQAPQWACIPLATVCARHSHSTTSLSVGTWIHKDLCISMVGMRAQETIHIARHRSPPLLPYWPNTLTAYLHLITRSQLLLIRLTAHSAHTALVEHSTKWSVRSLVQTYRHTHRHAHNNTLAHIHKQTHYVLISTKKLLNACRSNNKACTGP